MKRVGYLYEKVISIENLQLADKKASKGKSKQPGVIRHRANQERNIQALHEMLKNKTFKTSEYSTFKIYEPKERVISRLPFYPDRIVHHALMNVIGPILIDSFTIDTYSCIKGRGIHPALYAVKKALRNAKGTKYALKMDVAKFFPNVDHEILKGLLRRKIKDSDLLELLDGIVDSADGLPIGNYLSSTFANFYLTGFDHWIKEKQEVENYFRYCDDLVILHSDKVYLHWLRKQIAHYLYNKLKLEIKDNWQVFSVESRGLDFLGYKNYHTYTLLRKSIKQRFVRMMRKNRNRKSIASYKGWIDHCNGINLMNKYASISI